MPDLTPAEIASRSFRLRMRGYDPDEVHAYLSELASALGEITAEREQLRLQAGAPKDLGSEFEQIGREVTAVLEAAREAAESMRTRASADASRWRSEAVAEAESERRQARSDAENLRGDAWTTAAELLEQAQAEATRIRTEAEKEAMRLVGEAELETHRGQAQSRREAEEIVRAAKMDAEKLVLEAQARHEQLIEAAQRQAEAAQERARALESRRQELGRELESLRDALSAAEIELDEKREALNLSPPTVDAPEEQAPTWEGGETVRVVRSRPAEGTDDVPRRVGAAPIAPQPQIRVIPASELARRSGAEPELPEPPLEPAAEETRPEATEAEAVDDAGAEPAAGSEEAVEKSESAVHEVGREISDEPAVLEPAQSDGDAVDAVAGAPSPPGESVMGGDEAPAAPDQSEPLDLAGDTVSVESGAEDDVVELFARLREARQQNAGERALIEPIPTASSGIGESDDVTAPMPSRPDARRPGAVDHVAARDMRLLPITNRSLRNLKRQLTDEANVALDELRSTEGGWSPNREALAEGLRADLVVLTAESFGAGHATAEELLGEHLTRPATPKFDGAEEFAGDLADEIEHMLEETRASGAGPQQVGSAVSRVFRAWRTDETERRVRSMAITAYNRGLATSLTAAGRSLSIVVAGRGCATCRAAAEVAEVDVEHLPSFHPGCECLVVPG